MSNSIPQELPVVAPTKNALLGQNLLLPEEYTNSLLALLCGWGLAFGIPKNHGKSTALSWDLQGWDLLLWILLPNLGRQKRCQKLGVLSHNVGEILADPRLIPLIRSSHNDKSSIITSLWKTNLQERFVLLRFFNDTSILLYKLVGDGASPAWIL